VSLEVKAPNAGSLSAKPNGTELGTCPDRFCFQYSSLKGYSGWSRHLWIGQIEQVSFLGEAEYHITDTVILHLANICSSLQYIGGLHGRLFYLFRSCLL